MNGRSLHKQFYEMTDIALTTGLITIALTTLFVACFVKNKWIKAGWLAYELFP